MGGNLQLPPVLLLTLHLGLPTEQAESQGTLPGGAASVLIEIQTVPIAVRLLEDSKVSKTFASGLTLLYELALRNSI